MSRQRTAPREGGTLRRTKRELLALALIAGVILLVSLTRAWKAAVDRGDPLVER